VSPQSAERLTRAAGFRNVVAHAYETLDMDRVFAAAVQGPADLRAFLGALARIVENDCLPPGRRSEDPTDAPSTAISSAAANSVTPAKRFRGAASER
jgi:hypothetical protein